MRKVLVKRILLTRESINVFDLGDPMHKTGNMVFLNFDFICNKKSLRPKPEGFNITINLTI